MKAKHGKSREELRAQIAKEVEQIKIEIEQLRLLAENSGIPKPPDANSLPPQPVPRTRSHTSEVIV
jgi:hypothetical protein